MGRLGGRPAQRARGWGGGACPGCHRPLSGSKCRFLIFLEQRVLDISPLSTLDLPSPLGSFREKWVKVPPWALKAAVPSPSASRFNAWAAVFGVSRLFILTLAVLAIGFGLARMENQAFDPEKGNFNTLLCR